MYGITSDTIPIILTQNSSIVDSTVLIIEEKY
jgi:hypothetical protein